MILLSSNTISSVRTGYKKASYLLIFMIWENKILISMISDHPCFSIRELCQRSPPVWPSRAQNNFLKDGRSCWPAKPILARSCLVFDRSKCWKYLFWRNSPLNQKYPDMHKKVVFTTYVVCDFGCKHFQFLKKTLSTRIRIFSKTDTFCASHFVTTGCRDILWFNCLCFPEIKQITFSS